MKLYFSINMTMSAFFLYNAFLGNFPGMAMEDAELVKTQANIVRAAFSKVYPEVQEGTQPQSAEIIRSSLKNSFKNDKVSDELLLQVQKNEGFLKTQFPAEQSGKVPSTKKEGESSTTEEEFGLHVLDTQEPLHPKTCKYCGSQVTVTTDVYWSKENQKRYATALALDGGGLRGYLQALELEYLTKLTNRKPHELFDVIGGTSIGGILAMGLALPAADNKKNPALSTRDLTELFTERGGEIFPSKAWYNIVGKVADAKRSVLYSLYDAGPLENLLQSYFHDVALSSSLTNVYVIAAEADQQAPFIFNSLDKKGSGSVPMWKVGRATSAAPTFFKSYTVNINDEKAVRLVDGGLYRNNPAGVVATELLKLARVNKAPLLPDNMIVISLGTGIMPLKSILPTDGGWANSAKPVIETLMNSCSIGTHELMKDIIPTTNYLRVNPRLGKYISLDQVSEENFSILRMAANSVFDEIDEFVLESPFRHVLDAETGESRRLLKGSNEN